MENFVKKVIRASAGTGKTFRLSLEYIGLLLRYRHLGIRFNELLVITFTKKATSEIRERIFQHLKALVLGTEESQVIQENLQRIFGVELSQEDRHYLGQVYQDMLLNKDAILISTIDSFLHNVFSSIIAPYLGVTSYRIDNSTDEALFDEIYQFILGHEDNFKKIEALFRRTGKKRIEGYEKFVKSIIDNRWIFYLLGQQEEAPVPGNGNVYLRQFLDSYNHCFTAFVDYCSARYSHVAFRDVFKKNYYEIFFGDLTDKSLSAAATYVQAKLEDTDFLYRNYRLLLRGETFWNGRKVLSKGEDKPFVTELKDGLQEAAQALGEHLFHACLVPEQEEILQIADLVLQKYDEIKFREKVFTHNDIAYYTFRYLYDPALSLIEGDSVTNAFYEVLASRIRFVLVDEFQDTSILQFRILLPMMKEVISGMGLKEYGGVVVVGDEKQSIYGWRGGERDLLLQIPDILYGAESVMLDTSYRSDQHVIDAINRIFQHELLHQHLESRDLRWPYQTVRPQRQNASGYVAVVFRNYSKSGGNDENFSHKEDTVQDFIHQTLYPLIRDHRIPLKNTAILARKNSDLSAMAEVLDELEIPYVLESSQSILAHRAIQPMMFLLRYLSFRDVTDLLKFLRSDYVLLDTRALKRVLLTVNEMSNNRFSTSAFLGRLQDIPAMEKVHALFREFTGDAAASAIPDAPVNLVQIVKRVLETFNVIGIFGLENDVKNINRFMDIVATFQATNRDYPSTLKGFLEYCRSNGERDEFLQVGLQDVDAINLLTIHKAKGLEFDQVFCYWDLSERSGRNDGELVPYLRYMPGFNGLEDYALTYNFDDVLRSCSKEPLAREQAVRQDIEELNTFYVALTRAKKNLVVYFAFEKSGGYRKFLKEALEAEEPRIDRLMAATMLRVAQSDFRIESNDENHFSAAFGQLAATASTSEERSQEQDYAFVRAYLNPDRSQFLLKRKEREWEAHLDFKELFVEKRDVDRGNVAHYYLSFIKHARAQEFAIARSRTQSHYGNLFTISEIDAIITRVDQFIEQHPHLFSQELWPLVYTEYTLYTPEKQQVRLDRMMVNERDRSIMIVDYKTGATHQESQIEEYIRTVEALRYVRQSGFRVKGEFLEVDISE